MKVQEALKAAIEALENINNWLPTINQKGLRDYEYEALLKCKSALLDIEKCEPVAWMQESPAIGLSISLKRTEYHTKPLYTSQPIEKCEPVAEVVHSKDGSGIIGVNWLNSRKKLMYGDKLYTSPIRKECDPARDLLETDDGKWDGTIKALWRRLQGRHPSAEFWELSEIPDDEMYIFRAHFATALLASPIKQLNAKKG